jgi:hypothetical protein
MKLSDFKVGDRVFIKDKCSVLTRRINNNYTGFVTIVAFSADVVWDFIVDVSEMGVGYCRNGKSYHPDRELPKSEYSIYSGMCLRSIISKKIMRSKLADKLYKNFQKHGETEEYFYVNKDI